MLHVALVAATLMLASSPPMNHRRAAAGVDAPRAWVAAKKKKKAARPLPAPIRVQTTASPIDVKLKKKVAKAVLLAPGQELSIELPGAGTLAVVAYQALEGGKTVGSVLANTFVDGKPQAGVSFKGAKLAGASFVGQKGVTPSKPKSALLRISGGTHVVTVRVPSASAAVAIEIVYTPTGSKVAAPVEVSAQAPRVAPELPPPAAPPPALMVASEPSAPPPAPEAPSAPPTLAAAPVGSGPATSAPATPQTDIERRIAAGELRNGVVGTYTPLAIRASEGAEPAMFFRALSDKPFVFVCDGPGIATVRVHWLAGKEDPSGGVKLTLLENDVLMSTVDVDTAVAPGASIAGNTQLRVSAAKEYKLTIGPKVSRFAVQPSDNATAGVAVTYSFEAKEKTSSMALTLDLGDEMGGGDMAGATMLTEVSVRERVIEVEKVVHVEAGEEIVGVAAVGGIVAPEWRGLPAYAAGIEIRLNLSRWFALSLEAIGQRQDLAIEVADPSGVTVPAGTNVLALPLTAQWVTRIRVTDGFGFFIGAGGGMTYVRASGASRDAPVVVTQWVPTGKASLGMEVQIGPGWLAIDGGYLYAAPSTYDGVLDSYSPGGFPVAMRYRLGL
jgi:hypothetical protein